MPDIFETGKKRCGKQNSQTPLDLCSPQRKKLCKNNDNMPALEECVFSFGWPSRKVSELKRHQIEAALLSETDYLSRACDGSLSSYKGTREKEIKNHLSPCSISSPVHVAYTYGKKEDGISSSALGNIIPAYDEKIDNISIVSGVSADCLDSSDDIHIDQDQSKSFLKSCSFERSLLHERKPPARHEIFEFGSDDIGIKKRWTDYCDITEDEIDLEICGRDLQCDAAPPFQYSPITQYDMHGISEFPIRDSVNPSLLLRNILPDSSKQVWKCTSSWQSFRSGWFPLTAEEIVGIKFLDDDAIYKNLVEGCPEFRKSTVHGYSAQREDRDLKHIHENTKYSWPQQNCSFMKFSPDNKREIENTKYSWLQHNCSFMKSSPDDKREIGESRWGDFENMFTPRPFRRFIETDWSLSPLCGEERPKNYSVASLYETSPAEHESGRPDSRNQVTMLNRKKSSIRSHSAPPFYKGKKRYLDLTDSSTMLSAKCNFQNTCVTLSSAGLLAMPTFVH